MEWQASTSLVSSLAPPDGADLQDDSSGGNAYYKFSQAWTEARELRLVQLQQQAEAAEESAANFSPSINNHSAALASRRPASAVPAHQRLFDDAARLRQVRQQLADTANPAPRSRREPGPRTQQQQQRVWSGNPEVQNGAQRGEEATTLDTYVDQSTLIAGLIQRMGGAGIGPGDGRWPGDRGSGNAGDNSGSSPALLLRRSDAIPVHSISLTGGRGRSASVSAGPTRGAELLFVRGETARKQKEQERERGAAAARRSAAPQLNPRSLAIANAMPLQTLQRLYAPRRASLPGGLLALPRGATAGPVSPPRSPLTPGTAPAPFAVVAASDPPAAAAVDSLGGFPSLITGSGPPSPSPVPGMGGAVPVPPRGIFFRSSSSASLAGSSVAPGRGGAGSSASSVVGGRELLREGSIASGFLNDTASLETTFSPRILRRSVVLAARRNPTGLPSGQRLYNSALARQVSAGELGARAAQRELQGCTFFPALNNAPRSPAMGPGGGRAGDPSEEGSSGAEAAGSPPPPTYLGGRRASVGGSVAGSAALYARQMDWRASHDAKMAEMRSAAASLAMGECTFLPMLAPQLKQQQAAASRHRRASMPALLRRGVGEPGQGVGQQQQQPAARATTLQDIAGAPTPTWGAQHPTSSSSSGAGGPMRTGGSTAMIPVAGSDGHALRQARARAIATARAEAEEAVQRGRQPPRSPTALGLLRSPRSPSSPVPAAAPLHRPSSSASVVANSGQREYITSGLQSLGSGSRLQPNGPSGAPFSSPRSASVLVRRTAAASAAAAAAATRASSSGRETMAGGGPFPHVTASPTSLAPGSAEDAFLAVRQHVRSAAAAMGVSLPRAPGAPGLFSSGSVGASSSAPGPAAPRPPTQQQPAGYSAPWSPSSASSLSPLPQQPPAGRGSAGSPLMPAAPGAVSPQQLAAQLFPLHSSLTQGAGTPISGSPSRGLSASFNIEAAESATAAEIQMRLEELRSLGAAAARTPPPNSSSSASAGAAYLPFLPPRHDPAVTAGSTPLAPQQQEASAGIDDELRSPAQQGLRIHRRTPRGENRSAVGAAPRMERLRVHTVVVPESPTPASTASLSASFSAPPQVAATILPSAYSSSSSRPPSSAALLSPARGNAASLQGRGASVPPSSGKATAGGDAMVATHGSLLARLLQGHAQQLVGR